MSWIRMVLAFLEKLNKVGSYLHKVVNQQKCMESGCSLAWFGLSEANILRARMAMLTTQFSARNLFPFSFFGVFRCRVSRCLAGGESDEFEVGQLSFLWQVFAQGSVEGDAFCCSDPGEVSSLRQPEALEGRVEEDSFRGLSAVLLSRLRASFLSVVSRLSLAPLSLFESEGESVF